MSDGHERALQMRALDGFKDERRLYSDVYSIPEPANLAVQYAIPDDRARPYYEQRLVA